MGYTNGILETETGFRVRVKMQGKVLCRTFNSGKYGGMDQAKAEAERFVDTRRECQRVSATGIKNLYEKVCTIEGRTYLYLEVRKGRKYKSRCVGRMTASNTGQLKHLRMSPRYRDVTNSLLKFII